MELMSAHRNWATRPEDERFTSLSDLHRATLAHYTAAREREGVFLSTLRAEATAGDVEVVGRGGTLARLTHWAFGQLAQRASAPAAYLRTLPAKLAAENLNTGLMKAPAGEQVNMLVTVGDRLTVQALTSRRYERVWNHEVAERLVQLEAQGWEPARPDIRVQDDRLPLYASDHDMFAFVRSQNRIAEPGNEKGLQRGVIVSNSEVGAGSLKLQRFLYREMCGNHIIWGAEQVTELRLRHVGNIRERLSSWDAAIQTYVDSSASEDEAQIASAQVKRIAGTKAEVLGRIFGLKLGLSRTAIEAGYDAVVEHEDGDPRTVWGLLQGLTRHSQTSGFADARTTMDAAAGRLLAAF